MKFFQKKTEGITTILINIITLYEFYILDASNLLVDGYSLLVINNILF
jgi:hypothetical protein